MNRKNLKKIAKSNLKKHYILILFLCMFLGFTGIEYNFSFSAQHYQQPVTETLSTITFEGEDEAKDYVQQNMNDIKEEDTNPVLGRSRGILSSVVNSVASGNILVVLFDTILSVVTSKNITLALLILGAFIGYIFVWLFLKETAKIVVRRMILETRTYEKVGLQRILFPLRTGKWINMAWVMFVKCFYYFLWSFTIVGGFIKTYSYLLVPYILAENPSIEANTAITLSRKMMNGHKWEAFVCSLSFVGWSILDVFTMGLSGICFSNPYKACFFAEYYVYVRSEAKKNQIENMDVLNDTYLYEVPDSELLKNTYGDIKVFDEVLLEKPSGFFGFLSNWFGIMVYPDEKIVAYEKQRARMADAKKNEMILNGRQYPARLFPEKMVSKLSSKSDLYVSRSYPLVNLILMFFIFSFVGWLWEVSLHLISDGIFVNRGVLHGPWLPIYGFGGILILIVLKRFRENPAVQFVCAVVLCGFVEYFTSYYLQIAQGRRWWDYSGYFLNLNGRICAEGLFVFGLGGLAIVYLLAPLIDNALRKRNKKPLICIAAVLLGIYTVDQIYSKNHPNTGKGITDYTEYKN